MESLSLRKFQFCGVAKILSNPLSTDIRQNEHLQNYMSYFALDEVITIKFYLDNFWIQFQMASMPRDFEF